ncbi:MAG TPA: iron-sulfur cluster carrier protein ApbC [Xanthomonadales bacterium]|nr:iron-sulfur cluster carrier protein ApbC [Xanthomonadales bacterium]
MSTLDDQHIRGLLAAVRDEYLETDIVSAGHVRGIGVDEQNVAVDLRLPYPADGLRDTIVAQVKESLKSDPGIDSVVVNFDWKVVARKVQGELKPLDQIRNIIAVASGKGGVGKSTTAVNLALALAADGARVGILDADIYGPSIPTMLGAKGRPDTADKRIIPKQAHGLQLMSMGFLVEDETPMVWRGPMVTSALQQLLGETNWENLDFLVIDLPPGTGDIQLTLVQKVPVAGAVVVTTPQDIALQDARKAYQMFKKLELTVLGVVENMSTHICSECGHEEAIFGSGGAASMSDQYQIPLLGKLPLAASIRSDVDSGNPSVVSDPDGDIASAYMEFARSTAAQLSRQPRNLKMDLPEIKLQSS